MEDQITVKRDKKFIKVMINGLIHLCLDVKKLQGFQSYKDPEAKAEVAYCIEFYMDGDGMILSQYSSRARWSKVLELLDK